MPSFLIVKTSAIGDVIQTFPVLEYLRVHFPNACIDWVVERQCSDLLASHPFLNRVLSIDTKLWRETLFSSKTWFSLQEFYRELRKREYDALFDLQGNTKSALITLLAKARDKVGFGKESVSESLNLLATNKRYEMSSGLNRRLRYLKLVQAYFQDKEPFVSKGVPLNIGNEEKTRIESIVAQFPLRKGPPIMVSFGSRWRNKQVKEDTLIQFLELVSQKLDPSFLFIFGNRIEKLLADRLQSSFPDRSIAVGELSLPLWQALMYKFACVIAMDSAALHLCGTTPTPSFSIFGPSSASVYKPIHGNHYAFQGPCPYERSFESRCPILRTCSTGACIRNVDAEKLFVAFNHWWHTSVKETA